VSRRVVVDVDIAAPPARVWRALCDPAEVASWAGVGPLDVPDGYPAAGQHARWRARQGPLPLTLDDRVSLVEEERRLAATIEVGPAHIEEEYRLVPTATGTWLVSDNLVRGRWPGLGRVARHLLARDVRSAMQRLSAHCER
jgi:uncharacterized protein YndB with AHSA1/START domain